MDRWVFGAIALSDGAQFCERSAWPVGKWRRESNGAGHVLKGLLYGFFSLHLCKASFAEMHGSFALQLSAVSRSAVDGQGRQGGLNLLNGPTLLAEPIGEKSDLFHQHFTKNQLPLHGISRRLAHGCVRHHF